MPDILDTVNDFSSIASFLQLAVPGGAEVFHLLGKDVASSIKNWAILPLPGAVIGSPVINNPSGALTDSADYFALNPAIASAASEPNETYLFVAQMAASGINTTSHNVYNDLNKTNIIANGIALTVGGAGAYVQMGTSGGNILAGVGSNNAQTLAASKNPAFFAVTVDMTNLAVTIQTLSATAWTGVTPLTKTVAVASGATRPNNTNPRWIGASLSAQAVANFGTTHFFAKYNRVLSSSEIAAVFAQVKTIMAIRGVNIA